MISRTPLWPAVLLVTLALAGTAEAQSRGASQVPRYTPQSPTVSPYVSLLSRNGSVAGNYYGIVRPLQRQQRVNQINLQDATAQQQELQRLKSRQQQAFDQPTVKPTGTAGWFHEFGPVPPYQRTDHYYSQWDTGGGAPRRIRR